MLTIENKSLWLTFLWTQGQIIISLVISGKSSDMRMSSDCRWRWECVQFGPSAVVNGSRAVLAQPLDQHERSPLRRVFRRLSSHPSGSAGVTAGRWGEIMEKTVGIKISIWISWQAHVRVCDADVCVCGVLSFRGGCDLQWFWLRHCATHRRLEPVHLCGEVSAGAGSQPRF